MAGDVGPRLRSVPVGPPPSVYGDDDAPQMAYDASASVAAADMVNRHSVPGAHSHELHTSLHAISVL